MPSLTPPTLARVEITYTIPETCRIRETDPRVVVLRELTIAQETDAHAVAEGSRAPTFQLPIELLRRSVVLADGKPVDPDWIDGVSSPCRELMGRGMMPLQMHTQGDLKDFLASGVRAIK